jgi:hypothetical protein
LDNCRIANTDKVAPPVDELLHHRNPPSGYNLIIADSIRLALLGQEFLERTLGVDAPIGD